jgi:exosortase A
MLLLAVLLGSFVLAFFPVWKTLIETWANSEEYSHGFFIVPLCVYIVWREKEALAQVTMMPANWGLGLAILSLLIYLFAYLAEIATLASLSMILFVSAAVVYFYGFRMLWELSFPTFMLLFMIPVPGQVYAELTIPLQLFVSKVSVWFAAMTGIPVFREGNVIHLPDRTLEVVQACSGLRSMISLLTLSAVFGYLTLKSNLFRAALFVSGVPISVLVNVVRVIVLIFVSYYFGYDLTTGSVHTLFGLLIFALALLLLAALRGMFSIWDRSAKQE